MLTSERKTYLLRRLSQDGRLVARDLAATLAVSEDTIRRDLRELAAEGLLQRVHGGALPASPATGDFRTRKRVSPGGKAALAARAAGLLAPGQLVFLDGGTTNVALAAALPRTLSLRVVTHSPDIALALADHPLVALDLIGGRFFKHSRVAVGTAAANAIGRVRPDLFVMGVTGLHPDTGATTGDAEEAEIKALIAAQSAETMVLASAEKLGAASPFLIVPLGAVDTVIVEAGAPAETRAAIDVS